MTMGHLLQDNVAILANGLNSTVAVPEQGNMAPALL